MADRTLPVHESCPEQGCGICQSDWPCARLARARRDAAMPDPDYKALCAELLDAYAYLIDRYMTAPSNKDALVYRARAALARPEPEGPTDEEIDDWHGRCADLTRLGEADHYWAFDLRHDEVAGVARAVLAHWGTPANQPVPVSERLPGPEDCDSEGRCWVFDDMLGLPSWTLIKVLGKNLEPDITWLPHHALPMPTLADNTGGTH